MNIVILKNCSVMILLILLLFAVFATITTSADLPTNYEYFTSGGIHTGLSADQPYFTLNGKNITIFSGAIHYFRVPRAYWRDRLRKLRAAGFNTVESYIAWNIHEPRSGEFDFGNGENDMSEFANVVEFIKTAQEEDLFVILRPGPFICAEFEFGGFPSWLLREDSIEVRTSNSVYMNYVTRYFNVLLQILAPLQFTNSGSVIMFQVENEYANSRKKDHNYILKLRELMLSNGIKELLVTADNPDRGVQGTDRDLFLMTGTFYKNSTEQLDYLKHYQPTKPKMAMENYPGWFDLWGRRHNHKPGGDFLEGMEEILKYPASINIYMFHGGTSFGFMNGGMNLKLNDFNTDYHSITNSYYVSPLDESGGYTDLYYSVKQLVEQYNNVKTKLPDPPQSPEITAYPSVKVEKQLTFANLLNTVTSIESNKLVPMEKLNINNNNGQSFGYIVYRKTNLNLPAGAILQIDGRVCDTVMVLVNGVIVSPFLERAVDLNKFGTSAIENSTIVLTDTALNDATVDLVVENWGRINVAVYIAFKGLWHGGVHINGNYLSDWTIYPLEFQKSWTSNLQNWQNVDLSTQGPSLYKCVLQINEDPKDTFVYMENWKKGIVIINGFVLGRYAHMGPVQTLYLPGPFLKKGENDIVIFEHFQPYEILEFKNTNIYVNH